MSKRLVQGPAGSGKTHRVLMDLEALAAASPETPPAFVVLVPTYSQAEHLKRRLLKHSERGALLDRGIATFEQLAERRTGVRLSSLAPAAVRDGLLAEAFEEAAPDELRKSARFAGLRRAALRFLDELKALEPDPKMGPLEVAAQRFAAAAGALPKERAAKVAGLLRVLLAYQRRLAAAGLLDHGDLLRLLLASLRDGPPQPLVHFAADGFTDLTEIQERIVQRLAESAQTSIVTLLCDADCSDAGPFAAPARLRERLVASGFEVETLAPGRRFTPPVAALERRLAGADVAPFEPGAAIRFLAGADPEDEADRVARTVLRWTCEGFARADILVVVRSLESETAQRVLAALRRHGVPARRMGRRPLAEIPAARAALRTLRLLAGVEERGEVVSALRQGCARGVTDADADRLVLRAHERGADTLSDAETLARGRDDVPPLPTVLAWCETLRKSRPSDEPRPPSAVADALLAGVGVLLRFSFEEIGAHDDEERAAEDASAVRAVLDAVRDVVRALRAAGRDRVTPADLVSRVAAACDASRAGVRDLRDDAVNVVDAEEARQWEVRAAVVAGLRLGEWPGGAREDLFLADAERAEVAKHGKLALPSRIDAALRRERLLFYAAATRAREAVVFTAPAADEKGDPVLRSPFLDDALAILPEGRRCLEGEQRSPGDPRPAEGETFHTADVERAALAALTEHFVEGHETERRPQVGYALLEHLLARGESLSSSRTVRDAARWFAPPDAELSDGSAARARMAAPRARSASSLGDFAQCAFRHFARVGLGLRELPSGAGEGVDPLLQGDVAHRTLERVYAGGVLDPELAGRVFDAIWDEETARLRTDLRAVAARTELRRAIVERVERERDEPLVAGFAPRRFEWGFGPRGDREVEVGPQGAQVRLNGSVDRIDVSDAGDAVVVDWKWSNSQRFTGVEQDIDAGADLQLPIYALAVARGLGHRVVAVGYVTLRDQGVRWIPLVAKAPPETLSRRQLPAGWGEGDGSEALARAEAHVVDLDRAIRGGRIEVSPRDEDLCTWCPYADLCRYEGRPR